MQIRHNTDACWGRCSFCNAFGHQASQCRCNPENQNVENGVVKKAGESVENDGNMKRNEKRRLNRLKKKEEEKKKKTESEAAKHAIHVVVYNPSETEEDSPRKIEVVHTARQARVLRGSARG